MIHNETNLEVSEDASQEQMSFIRDRVIENNNGGKNKGTNLSFGDDYEVPAYLRDRK